MTNTEAKAHSDNTSTDVNNQNASTAASITMLNNYFRLFDASRTDARAMEDLLSLFTPDAEIVLNGNSRRGFEGFMKAFYEYNQDIKHMWEAWVPQPDGSYRTNWAVSGQAADGKVYAKAGIDIARVNDQGQIVYFENAFSKYHS